jgi:hypothetical protein
MTRTLTTLTAAGALVAATLVTTPARAMDPWTAAAWFVGGLFVAGLFWAPYARAARPYGYAGAYGYAPGSAYGYSAGYSPGYSTGYAYRPTVGTVGMERRQARRSARRNLY